MIASLDKQPSSNFRLRRLKATLLSVSLTLAGILLIMLNAWLRGQSLGVWSWLHDVPLDELGGALFAAGFLGTLERIATPQLLVVCRKLSKFAPA